QSGDYGTQWCAASESNGTTGTSGYSHSKLPERHQFGNVSRIPLCSHNGNLWQSRHSDKQCWHCPYSCPGLRTYTAALAEGDRYQSDRHVSVLAFLSATDESWSNGNQQPLRCSQWIISRTFRLQRFEVRSFRPDQYHAR